MGSEKIPGKTAKTREEHEPGQTKLSMGLGRVEKTERKGGGGGGKL